MGSHGPSIPVIVTPEEPDKLVPRREEEIEIEIEPEKREPDRERKPAPEKEPARA
jgi:hypothetical protein